jgi:L-rhamnose mutarotase
MTDPRSPVRVGILLEGKQDKLAEYQEHHCHIWPEMLTVLNAAGWHNHSLFLRDDGLLSGYFETPLHLSKLLPGWIRQKSMPAGRR